MTDYNKRAIEFLKETNTIFKVKFIKNGLYFQDDKEPRDIFLITLKRNGLKFSFKFGQSIADSTGKGDIKPTECDFLSCVEKYEYSDFNEFCSEFGYDEDSRKALKTFKAIQKEFNKISSLYSEEELNKLREIQ